ncbi:MAG: patatin-like phospholipase family protein [Treponema sp.]
MSKIKTGLVLEGGAMRGLFTAGVLDVFMENGVTFDGMIGVSAGAAFGCNFKSRQIGRVIRYNKKYGRDRRYCSLWSLIKTGDLYGADFCYNILPNKLDVFDVETFKNNPMPLYIVASDCETGMPVYKELKNGDAADLTWMRASASMPLVSRVVEIDGYKLLDGGMTDSIPIRYFESLGYNRNVVILTQPADYKKSPGKAARLLRAALRKYPALAAAMQKRHIVYNEETTYIFEKAARREIFVICPEFPLGIRRTERNPAELQRVYDAGRTAAEKNLAAVKEFLVGEKENMT